MHRSVARGRACSARPRGVLFGPVVVGRIKAYAAEVLSIRNRDYANAQALAKVDARIVPIFKKTDAKGAYARSKKLFSPASLVFSSSIGSTRYATGIAVRKNYVRYGNIFGHQRYLP